MVVRMVAWKIPRSKTACAGGSKDILHIFRDAEDLTRYDFFVFLMFQVSFRMIVFFGKRDEGNRRVKILMRPLFGKEQVQIEAGFLVINQDTGIDF